MSAARKSISFRKAPVTPRHGSMMALHVCLSMNVLQLSALGRTFRHSFDYFISAQKERHWDRQVERLGAGQIDDELKPGWLFRVRRGL